MRGCQATGIPTATVREGLTRSNTCENRGARPQAGVFSMGILPPRTWTTTAPLSCRILIRPEAGGSEGSMGCSRSSGTATLSAARTVTPASSPNPGDREKHVRTGGDTGGPWNLSMGGVKNLAQNTWVEIVYNGSAWAASQYGSL